MTDDLQTLLEALRRCVGTAHVLTHDQPGADLSAWEQDWRKRSRGNALAIVRPGSTDEVAAVVQLCARLQAQTGISIVPQGGNTSMVVGAVPDSSGLQVVLNLQRMNRVLGLDAGNLTLTAEAGCVLQNLQETAQQAGFLFPLSLAAEGSCTIGGNLGTNAGGTQVVRYGNTRDLCLGLEVVTAQGAIWNGLSGLRKDNTGYDLRHLFIGSEGTLGIITAATMKLVPLPAAQLTAWAAVPSMDHALALLGLAHRILGAGLTGFEVMGQFGLSLVARHMPQATVPLYETTPWCVLLEVSDHESESHARAQFEQLLEAGMEQGCITDGVVAESIAQAKALWQIRENMPMAQAMEGLDIKHDISIPISRIPEFVRVTDALLAKALPGIRMVDFGHLGDGNLHYNVQAPEGVDAAQFLREHEATVNTLVFESVAQFGGSISAEHGVGSLKVDKLPHYKSPVALDMMRAIKRALDPDNLMNPGRVLRM
ncbi:MAG: FAD-binding oxidoreductase [Burkholderiaceae bacterium]